MIKVEFSGNSSAEVHALIKSFADKPNEVSTEAPKKKKAAEEEQGEEGKEEPAAGKKAAGKKAALTEETVRAKLVGTGWPKEDMQAFTKKFGYDRIPEIPSNKYQEYVDELDTVIEMSDKERKKYLASDEDL